MRMSFRATALMGLAAGLALGLVFAAGVAWGRSSAPETLVTVQAEETIGRTARERGSPPGARGGAAEASRAQPVTGTVARVDGDTLEVTTASGSVSVKLSAETAVRRSIEASAADITAGQAVLVQARTNPDGSLVATSIQVGPPETPSQRRQGRP